MKFWISGYSRETLPSAALYDLNQPIPLWRNNLKNPSFLCRAGDCLYALGEQEDRAVLSSFRQQGDTWAPLDHLELEGGALCHITTDSSRSLLAGSCWGSGHFFVIRLQPDGRFGKVLFHRILDDGTGRLSRVHYAQFIGSYLYAVNIQLDSIFCFRITREGPVFRNHVSLPAGCGPRHFFADRKRRLFYCVTEYSSELLVLDAGCPEQLSLISRHALLDPCFHGSSTGSTLAVSRDSAHLYAANRGEDTIVHFCLDADGTPHVAERVSCHGRCPRHIALLDQDRLLGIANQKSDSVILLERNPEDGSLNTEAFAEIPFASPSFLQEELSLIK